MIQILEGVKHSRLEIGFMRSGYSGKASESKEMKNLM